MGEIIFKKSRIEDLKELKDIYTYYIENSTATFHIGDITDDEFKKIIFCENTLYESFVILKDEKIVGYVLLAPYKNREAYMRSAEVTIYIKQEFVGCGIGKKAITFIENKAKEKNIKSLLAIICGENYESIGLFESMDYYKCGHMKNVGEKFNKVLDIVIYEKEI